MINLNLSMETKIENELTTPEDSGIVCDSLMMDSLTSQNELELDQNANDNVLADNGNENPMTTSTFDENVIVYRRKAKNNETLKQPKKRVSFHEDILKSTRTNNIHIEHGFVTYRHGRSFVHECGPGRYSWCSQGENEDVYKKKNQIKGHVYRNACSDVLYDFDGYKGAHYENLVVDSKERKGKFSSDSSSTSTSSGENSPKERMYSSDFSIQNPKRYVVEGECYFSEPSINIRKSSWNKEIKPKSSCLKKSKYSDIPSIENNETKIKRFNMHRNVNDLLDNSKSMLIGSLKSIFSLPIAERGVPEGSEDAQCVTECLLEKSVYDTPETPDAGETTNIPEIKQKRVKPNFIDMTKLRNKYVVDGEGSIFEHSGVSIGYESNLPTCSPDVVVGEKMEPNEKSSPFGGMQNKIYNLFKSLGKQSPNKQSPIKAPTPSTDGSRRNSPSHSLLYDSKNTSPSPSKMSISATLVNQFRSVPSSPSHNNIYKVQQSTKTRHLPSPIKSSKYQLATTNRMSPDLFNLSHSQTLARKLSENFNDILTVKSSDDTPEITVTSMTESMSSNCTSTYSNSILNSTSDRKRFSVKPNPTTKITDKKPFTDQLYSPIKTIDPAVIKNLNEEIAMEIRTASPMNVFNKDGDNGLNCNLGIGELDVDLFKNSSIKHNIFISQTEYLCKVFKLYTAYSKDGEMTPVLVFLSSKALYITEMVNNKLSKRYVLPYAEVDVILLGPSGSIMILSNNDREKQQVLLSGGTYPAYELVSHLEICVRKQGLTLPAVGQLTLNHLSSLQSHIQANVDDSRNSKILYYSVVCIPTMLNSQLDTVIDISISGFLMFRRLRNSLDKDKHWNPGYFTLKNAVLYMFNDSNQKLPLIAFALAECKGAHRALAADRPHCFDLVMKSGEIIQFAAPDEYVASDWLQSLVQAASGLQNINVNKKALGCTLVLTENSLVTIREDFSSPLQKVNLSKTEEVITVSLAGSATEEKFNTLSCNSAVRKETDILFSSAIEGLNTVRVSSDKDIWWCILDFECQEMKEDYDDLILMFPNASEMQTFLTMLEEIWVSKQRDLFPMSTLDDDDELSIKCTNIYLDLSRSWEPLISAAMF